MRPLVRKQYMNNLVHYLIEVSTRTGTKYEVFRPPLPDGLEVISILSIAD